MGKIIIFRRFFAEDESNALYFICFPLYMIMVVRCTNMFFFSYSGAVKLTINMEDTERPVHVWRATLKCHLKLVMSSRFRPKESFLKSHKQRAQLFRLFSSPDSWKNCSCYITFFFGAENDFKKFRLSNGFFFRITKLNKSFISQIKF